MGSQREKTNRSNRGNVEFHFQDTVFPEAIPVRSKGLPPLIMMLSQQSRDDDTLGSLRGYESATSLLAPTPRERNPLASWFNLPELDAVQNRVAPEFRAKLIMGSQKLTKLKAQAEAR